jgi:deoxycytidylate deaminase
MDSRTITHRDIERFQQAFIVSTMSDVRFPMGCVIYSGRKIIAAATNILKTHPDHKKRYAGHVVSIHAEHRAILRPRGSVAGGTLYVARHTGNGNSKPCATCMLYIQEAAIKFIVYKEGGILWKLKV